MKLSAYISPILYKQYCRIHWFEDNDDSLRRFLREVGTHLVSFQDGSGGEFRPVPPGTCIRLHTSDKYGLVSTRFLNLYATMYSKHDDYSLQPKVVVAPSMSSGWCGHWFRFSWW